MKTLHKLLPTRGKSYSLFVKLLHAFITIIIVLVSFHFITISLAAENLRKEIVKYNTLTLNNTVESYEQYFGLVHETMLSFLISEDVQAFRKKPRYIKFPVIQAEINKIVSNPLMHINDIILYSGTNSQILGKSNSTDPETMFTTFMVNERYSKQFWEKQFSEPYRTAILSAASFTDLTFPKTPSVRGDFFPAVYKGHSLDPFYLMALLDTQGMFGQFHVSINDNLFILDGDQIVFSSRDDISLDNLPLIPEHKSGYVLANDQYYFYMNGSTTGFTYINKIPMENVAVQTQTKVTLLLILGGAIIVSIAAVYIFIRKINNPLQRVIESLQDMNMKQPVTSSIREFGAISDHIAQLVRSKQSMNQEFDQKKSIIQHYSYINQLKNIRNNLDVEKAGMFFNNKPFVIVLFECMYRAGHAREAELKWYAYVKEFIDVSISLSFASSLTFHIEKNQILSFIFVESRDDMMPVVEKIKAVLDLDRSFGFSVIAVSSQYNHSSDLTKAYEEANQLLQQRTFCDETEIIDRLHPRHEYRGFSVEQEQMFNAHLSNGNSSNAIEITLKVLSRLKQHKSFASDVQKFVKLVLDKCLRELSSLQIEVEEMKHFYHKSEAIAECYTFGELESFMTDFINDACERMKAQMENNQPDTITDFVIEYVERHYAQEIYLDDLADRLKKSSGYLSAYFKEKTGKNFSEYLHEVRISKAKQMLNETNLKIGEVAQKAGYQNINSFNRMFKKYAFMTPGEYRKNNL